MVFLPSCIRSLTSPKPPSPVLDGRGPNGDALPSRGSCIYSLHRRCILETISANRPGPLDLLDLSSSARTLTQLSADCQDGFSPLPAIPCVIKHLYTLPHVSSRLHPRSCATRKIRFSSLPVDRVTPARPGDRSSPAISPAGFPQPGSISGRPERSPPQFNYHH